VANVQSVERTIFSIFDLGGPTPSTIYTSNVTSPAQYNPLTLSNLSC
jgi:hypothetical protein